MKSEIQTRRTIRNLIIFTAGIIALPWLGLALDINRGVDPHDQQNSLGWLLFILAPVLCMLLLRIFGGDGWRDFGLQPRLKGNGGWYAFALFFHPLSMSAFILAGLLLGVTSVPGLSTAKLGLFGQAILVMAVPSLIKNIFEEFAWRGYLTPKINALISRPLAGHMLVGLIWFSWHLVYYLRLLPPETLQKATALSLAPFLLLSLVGMFPTAIVYGELRLLTGSVWPAVLIHTSANVFFDALLLQGIFSTPDTGASLLISPGLFSLATLVTNALVGLWLYRRRTSRTAEASHA